MWRACGDDSGSESLPGLVVGGLLGRDREWERLERDWQKYLDQYGLEEFHASDMDSPGGPCADWPKKKVGAMMADFTSAITSRKLRLLGSSVILSDFRRVAGSHQWSANTFNCPFGLSFSHFIQQSVIATKHDRPTKKVAVVMDQLRSDLRSKGDKIAKALTEDHVWRQNLTSVTFASFPERQF